MKNALVILFAVLLMACTSTKNERKNALLVGAASASVNPDPGAFIAGDKQNRKFRQVHDSLYAKAFVADDGSTTVAIVTIDCIGLLYPEVNRIREKAASLTGIPADNIIVSSTHTHSGPDVVGLWGEDYQHSGVDTAYVSFLVNTAARQVREAFAKRAPAVMIAAETTYGEEWVQNICDEEIDRSVSVLRFVSPDGKGIASLTNFACHPTFLDARFDAVSADYVAGFYLRMKKNFGGENLFLQGAIGGWVQPVDGEGTFEKAMFRGDELAMTVMRAFYNGDTLTDFTIRQATKVIQLPVDNEGWKQLAAIGTIKRDIGDSLSTEITWLSIGNAQFATHPGETTPYLGLVTKKMMTTGPRFVLGLSQDALGYILKPEYFDDPGKPHAEYLTRMSLGKQTSPLLERHLQELVTARQSTGTAMRK